MHPSHALSIIRIGQGQGPVGKPYEVSIIVHYTQVGTRPEMTLGVART